MSASEKLQALDQAIIAAVHRDDATGQVMTEAESAAQPLIDALPQIVAVVEAAEELRRSQFDIELRVVLVRTLADLDEALS